MYFVVFFVYDDFQVGLYGRVTCLFVLVLELRTCPQGLGLLFCFVFLYY